MRIRSKVEIPAHYRTLKIGQVVQRGDLMLDGRWWEEVMLPEIRMWYVADGELVIRRVRAKGENREAGAGRVE